MTSHPYSHLEGTRIWATVERALEELVDNQDLEETTDRRYIVGSLVQELVQAGLGGMNSPDDACEQSAGSGVAVSLRDLDDETILIEGDRRSLEFLARLIQAQAGFDDDCGFQISPDGAGSSFFAAGSKGLYIHRTDQGECSLDAALNDNHE